MDAVGEDILESKEFRAAKKLMGEKEAMEFCKRESDALKSLIVQNTTHTHELTEKTRASSEYKKAVEAKKSFDSALKSNLKSTSVATKLATRILCARKQKLREA